MYLSFHPRDCGITGQAVLISSTAAQLPGTTTSVLDRSQPSDLHPPFSSALQLLRSANNLSHNARTPILSETCVTYTPTPLNAPHPTGKPPHCAADKFRRHGNALTLGGGAAVATADVFDRQGLRRIGVGSRIGCSSVDHLHSFSEA
jgi:hypothetical protein